MNSRHRQNPTPFSELFTISHNFIYLFIYFLPSGKKLPIKVFFFLYRPTSYTAVIPSENSFVKKLKTSGRSLVVFYGSQTGTGEEFAGRLAKEGLRYQMKGMVADPEECDMVRI